MPYAISLKSLNDTAAPIFRLWRGASLFESLPSMQALNYPPHLTLAIYEDIAADVLRETIDAVFRDTDALSLNFSGIGHFPNECLILWARPTDSHRLRQMYEAIHREIDPALCHPYYRPGHWQPHCTIATDIPMASAEVALAWAAKTPAEFTVTFDVADCVKAHPVEILAEVRLGSDPSS